MIDARLLDAVGTLITAHARPGHVPLIGIAGAQGSGKTTLARLAAERLSAAHLSLDDVYLTKAEREAVLDWRCEQEAGLMGLAPADLPAERRAALVVFIQAFERITRSMLAGGVRADVTFALDEHRRPFSP